MDLNLIVAAHRLPANQLVFDQEAFDRAVMRAEKRKLRLGAIWSRVIQFGAAGDRPKAVTGMAMPGRPA